LEIEKRATAKRGDLEIANLIANFFRGVTRSDRHGHAVVPLQANLLGRLRWIVEIDQVLSTMGTGVIR
jgi:hypothetical protein